MYVISVHSTDGSTGEACESRFTVLTAREDQAKALLHIMQNECIKINDELYVTYSQVNIDFRRGLHTSVDVMNEMTKTLTRN